MIDISGDSPCPNLVIDPKPVTGIYAFPATVVDTEGSLGCYSEQPVAVRNIGACPATIDDISATGDDYAVTSPTTFPIVLPPGEETLEAIIRFTPKSDPDPLTPNAVTGLLSVSSDAPNTEVASLCGESVARSGIRILVTDVTSGTPLPIEGVDSLTVQSKGKKSPSPTNLQFTDLPVLTANICTNDISYHVNLETLPALGTTGSNPKSSYQVKAMEGNLQTNQSFGLGQCEFRDFQLQLQASDPDDEICLLAPKGDSCTLDSQCCSGKCKGPGGSKTCK